MHLEIRQVEKQYNQEIGTYIIQHIKYSYIGDEIRSPAELSSPVGRQQEEVTRTNSKSCKCRHFPFRGKLCSRSHGKNRNT